MDPLFDESVDDDEERRALEAEFKRLYAEQELLNLSHDFEAWKRHIAALVEFQVRLERRHSRG